MDKRTEILERVCVQKQPCLNVGWVHEMEFEEDLEEETEIWGLGSEDTRAVEEEMQWECRPAAEPPADSKSTRTEGYCSERQEHCRAKWARGFQEWEAAILFSRKYLKLKMHPFKGEHLLKNQKPNFHWITTVTLLVCPEINAERENSSKQQKKLEEVIKMSVYLQIIPLQIPVTRWKRPLKSKPPRWVSDQTAALHTGLPFLVVSSWRLSLTLSPFWILLILSERSNVSNFTPMWTDSHSYNIF